jgi:DNA-binding protein HU-beta
MTKAQLIDAIAGKANIRKIHAKKALNAFTSVASAALKNGDRVVLQGFGSFSVATRNARVARNPLTGEKINIPDKRVLKFRSGNSLTDQI